MKNFYTLFTALLIALATNAQSEWEWVQTAPVFHPLDSTFFTSIKFLSTSCGYAVTNRSAVYRTNDGGDHWDSIGRFSHDIHFKHFSYIEILNKDTLCAAGRYDSLFYFSFDGGTTWTGTQIHSICPGIGSNVVSLRLTNDTMYLIHFNNYCATRSFCIHYNIRTGLSKTDILPIPFYLVGREFSSAGVNAIIANNNHHLYIECDTGFRLILSQYSENIGGFFALSPTEFFVSVNWYGPILKSYVLHSLDGGESWLPASSVDTLTYDVLHTDFMATGGVGWALGSYDLFETRNGWLTSNAVHIGDNLECFGPRPDGILYSGGRNLIRINTNAIAGIPEMKNALLHIKTFEGKIDVRCSDDLNGFGEVEFLSADGTLLKQAICIRGESISFEISKRGVFIVKLKSSRGNEVLRTAIIE